jgi:hypothetical protein
VGEACGQAIRSKTCHKSIDRPTISAKFWPSPCEVDAHE